MTSILFAISAVIVISLISLVGIFALSVKEATLDRILFILLSFSAGSILGTAFLDLLPEAVEFMGHGERVSAFMLVTIGFLGFFFLERFIYWFHGHVHGYEPRPVPDKRLIVKKFVYLNLIGDGIHNLIDGMVIAAGFELSTQVGLAATIAVFFHELPQEIGDFGVLVYGGFPRYRALIFNFISALSAIVGVLLTHSLLLYVTNFIGILMGVAAGGFIYIGASELIPEIQKEHDLSRSALQFILFILGIIFMLILNFTFHE